MTRALRTFLCGGVASLAAVLPASAQTGTDLPAPSTAKIQLGPLGLTPRISLRNLGVDTNIFNASEQPEKDFTATLMPEADSWLQLGRVGLASTTSLEWNYFHKSTTQRALNLSEKGRIELDLTRLTPYVGGSYVRTRQRPNAEIDQRVQQLRRGGEAGVKVRAGARLGFDVNLRTETLDFGSTKFGDAVLAQALNRDSKEGSLSLEYELTPLTTFVVKTAARYDRFETARERDTDALSLMPGLRFTPDALISGSLFVGVRRFRTLDPLVPDYTGLAAGVEVSYVARDMTKLAGTFKRDIEYSFEPLEPFYVSTMRGLEVTQILGYSWDVVGRVSFGTLSYKGLLLPDVGATADRHDQIFGYGAGFGRRLGDDLRIGINVDYAKRTSDRTTRVFDGVRVGGAVTYGY